MRIDIVNGKIKLRVSKRDVTQAVSTSRLLSVAGPIAESRGAISQDELDATMETLAKVIEFLESGVSHGDEATGEAAGPGLAKGPGGGRETVRVRGVGVE